MHLVFLWLILRPFDSPLMLLSSRSCWRPSSVVAIETMSSAYLILLIMTPFMETPTGFRRVIAKLTPRADWTSLGIQYILDGLLIWFRPSWLVLWGDAQLLCVEHKRCGEYGDFYRRPELLVVNWTVLHVWPYRKYFCSTHKMNNMYACAFSEQKKTERNLWKKSRLRISMKSIETQSINAVTK